MTTPIDILASQVLDGRSYTDADDTLTLGQILAARNNRTIEFTRYIGFATKESRAKAEKLLERFRVAAISNVMFNSPSADDEDTLKLTAPSSQFPGALTRFRESMFYVPSKESPEDGYLLLLDGPYGDNFYELAFSSKIGNPDEYSTKIIEEAINVFSVPPPQRDPTTAANIYAMVATQNGANIQSIGRVGQKLERGNYMPEVLRAFDMVVEDIGSDEPSGRIAIFNGPPGTGKTHLVKSIMQECSDANFVMVNPDDVRTLTSPGGLTALMNFNNGGYRGRVVLVLEDADSVLVPRAGDNMHNISSLLNLTDGIWGAALDLRVLATTNAKTLEFDSAITRPGRLTVMETIGKLDENQANAVYKRLTGAEGNLGPSTLAEVYAAAGGRVVRRQKKQKLGFGG